MESKLRTALRFVFKRGGAPKERIGSGDDDDRSSKRSDLDRHDAIRLE